VLHANTNANAVALFAFTLDLVISSHLSTANNECGTRRELAEPNLRGDSSLVTPIA
jgi:hypothetical protein